MVIVGLLAGCGDGASDEDGGAMSMDAGPVSTDAAAAGDAGIGADAGDPGSDAGSTDDAGAGLDAGATDGGQPDGGGAVACTATMPCPSGGVCGGGPTCDDAWTCSFTPMPCTDDLVEYCGCDGSTFSGSSTCPDRPFAHRGPCAGAMGFDCDRTKIRCRAVEPTCPAGQVPEVMGSCWSFRCVPLTECGCTDGAQCPFEATCDAGSMRCQPAP